MKPETMKTHLKHKQSRTEEEFDEFFFTPEKNLTKES